VGYPPFDDGHMSDTTAYVVLAGLLLLVLAWVTWVLYDQSRRLSKDKGARCPLPYWRDVRGVSSEEQRELMRPHLRTDVEAK
jgi:hypothetical protein